LAQVDVLREGMTTQNEEKQRQGSDKICMRGQQSQGMAASGTNLKRRGWDRSGNSPLRAETDEHGKDGQKTQ